MDSAWELRMFKVGVGIKGCFSFMRFLYNVETVRNCCCEKCMWNGWSHPIPPPPPLRSMGLFVFSICLFALGEGLLEFERGLCLGGGG